MRELLECFREWLAANRTNANAYALCSALVSESLKRADSRDPEQMEFDAQALAEAASRPEGVQFESAKRLVERAEVIRFVEARRDSLEEFFRSKGFSQCLKVERRSPGGRHRAVWYLQPYQLATTVESEERPAQPRPAENQNRPPGIEYDLTPAGAVRPSLFGRVLIGSGSFVTRSARGLLWMTLFLGLIALGVGSALTALGFIYVRRPVQTSDLATLVALLGFVWFIWVFLLRPLVWLLDDRIILATEFWVGWKEDTAQLELSKDAEDKTRLQLVRYSAVCPVCSGKVEVRYSPGPNRRRLVGCCAEAPQDHVFSFDRVLRRGTRLHET